MECCECRWPLEATNTPCYLYTCGHFACFLHVTGPYCPAHPDHLLIDDLDRDYAIRELKGLLEKYSQNDYMYNTVAGIRADMCAYVQEILRNGRLLRGAEEGSGRMCPSCGTYMGGNECLCGSSYGPPTYPTDNQTGLPLSFPSQPPCTSTETQTQTASESREVMTESGCEGCKLPVNSSYLCADCIGKRAVVCSACKQEITMEEVRCGQCHMPVSCLKCGKYVPNPHCQDCLIPIPPETAEKTIETDPFLCEKCSNPLAFEVTCRKCSEPGVPECIKCHRAIVREEQICENCLRLAHFKCTNCQSPIISGELLCSLCNTGKLARTVVKDKPSSSKGKHLELEDDSEEEGLMEEAQPSTPKISLCLPTFDPKKRIRIKAREAEHRAMGRSKPGEEDAPNHPQDPPKSSPISLNPVPPKSSPIRHSHKLRALDKK